MFGGGESEEEDEGWDIDAMMEEAEELGLNPPAR